MTYPMLTASTADKVAGAISARPDEPQPEELCTFAGGADYPRERVEAAAHEAQRVWLDERHARKERGESAGPRSLEAFMASRVHHALRDLPMTLRQDFGFWRYLALFPYRWYLLERENELKPQDYGGTAASGENGERRRQTSPSYQLMLRTFLWGKIAFDPEEDLPYRRATLVNETDGAVMDIWHSHLVRIQLGQLGPMPHAFLDAVCAAPTANSTKAARLVEKRLTRMKHTVLYDIYEPERARRLADEQKTETLRSSAEGSAENPR